MSDPFAAAHWQREREAKEALERGQIMKRIAEAKVKEVEAEKPAERYKPQWPI